MIKAVIFDCDGTLIDSEPCWHQLFKALAQITGNTLTEQELYDLNSNTLPESVAYFHAAYKMNGTVDELMSQAHSILLHAYETDVKPRPGAVEFVRFLHRAGVKLAVASSSPGDFLKAGLTNAGIYDLFDVVASSQDEGTTKRNPAFVRSVAKRLGLNPVSCWCVDDSVYALEAMRKAGFNTLGIYDSDVAGTWDQLEKTADAAISSFVHLDFNKFLNGGLVPHL